MVILNRSELIARLRENVVLVSFIKVNGEPRQMRCTLIPSYFPPISTQNQRADSNAGSETSGIVNVWDVDKQDWRAFLLERVNWTMCPAPSTVLTPAPVRQAPRTNAAAVPSAIEAALRD